MDVAAARANVPPLFFSRARHFRTAEAVPPTNEIRRAFNRATTTGEDEHRRNREEEAARNAALLRFNIILLLLSLPSQKNYKIKIHGKW